MFSFGSAELLSCELIFFKVIFTPFGKVFFFFFKGHDLALKTNLKIVFITKTPKFSRAKVFLTCWVSLT